MTRARRLRILPLLLACGVALIAAAGAFGAGSHGATVGIGDEQPTMFSNGAYKALDTKIARYVTPYDVMSDHSANDLPRLRHWLAAAARDHVQPLVAFYHSDRTPKKMPSVKAYTKAVKQFLHAFPNVKLLQPWNEANRGTVRERGDSYVSPSAKQSAQYYLALRGACHSCTIVGLDVLDSTDVKSTVAYINAFKHDVGRSHLPSIWGLHNYSDTNRFHEGGTKAVLADTTGQVWLTETGGLAKLSPSFPFNLSRQARATSYMFKLASLSSRIARLYIFQWTGGVAKHEAFDAGLTDVHAKPRPAYCVVYEKLRNKKKCPYKTVKD
jgi:hypothetical protein